MMEEKKCSCCGKTKCVLEFYFNTRSKDGLTSQCKQCMKEKALKWQAENKDKANANRQRYTESKRGQYTSMLRRMAKKEQHDSSIR